MSMPIHKLIQMNTIIMIDVILLCVDDAYIPELHPPPPPSHTYRLRGPYLILVSSVSFVFTFSHRSYARRRLTKRRDRTSLIVLCIYLLLSIIMYMDRDAA